MSTLRFLLTLLLLSPGAAFCAEPAAPVEPSGTNQPDYRVSSRDTIEFTIYNQVDMTTVQRVTTTGEIRLPLIGTVKVAGLTLREAELLLESKYRGGGYFVDPQAILNVQKYGERFVAVLGQVKEPARITLASEDSTLGLLQAITQTGGFTRVARSDAVQVLRHNNSTGQDERLTINMDDIIRPKSATSVPDFQLHAGDVVFVPERVF